MKSEMVVARKLLALKKDKQMLGIVAKIEKEGFIEGLEWVLGDLK